MSVLFLIKILVKALCCATLVMSVIPLVMMPLRILPTLRDEVKLELERGEDTDNPLFMCMIYALLIVGIVFSLYQLGFVCYLLAIVVGSACLCLLASLFLLCDIVAVIYIWVGKRRRLRSKESQVEA